MPGKLFIGPGQHLFDKIRIAQNTLVTLQPNTALAKVPDRVPAPRASHAPASDELALGDPFFNSYD
jgi:hypothetical protein